jgi:hypothetical protein
MIRKTILALIAFCLGMAFASAQNYQDVVYLSNGSIIRGIIVEQIPGKTLKIETANGSVIVCDFADVARITKEVPASESKSLYGWQKAPRYRGFVEESVGFALGDYSELANIQILTSHGCQINPYIYAGGGVAFRGWSEIGGGDYYPFNLVLFAHARSELHSRYDGRCSPYFDLKAGYATGDFDGFYCSPSVGFHVYFGKTVTALGVGLGYDLVTVGGDMINSIALSVSFDF